jgi:hypothetical protein
VTREEARVPGDAGPLWAGGQGVYEAVRDRTPQSMTCDEAQTTPPSAAWIHLTGCRVNVMEAAYKTRLGVPTGDIFIPLAPRDRRASGPVHFVLATKDPDIVAVAKEMAALDGKDTGAAFAFLAKNAKRLIRDKDVTGMVQSGIDKDDKLHRRLRELNKDLVADFVVVDEGRRPNPLVSLLLLVGGLALVLVIGVSAAKK